MHIYTVYRHTYIYIYVEIYGMCLYTHMHYMTTEGWSVKGQSKVSLDPTGLNW